MQKFSIIIFRFNLISSFNLERCSTVESKMLNPISPNREETHIVATDSKKYREKSYNMQSRILFLILYEPFLKEKAQKGRDS